MKTYKLSKVGSLIDAYAEDNKLNLNVIARASGLKRHQIVWLKDGTHIPKVDTLQQVLNAIGKDLVIIDKKQD